MSRSQYLPLFWQYTGEVQQYEAFKRWSARVRKTPPPKQDPLAPPKKGRSSGKGSGKGGDEAALVTAIRCGTSLYCLAGRQRPFACVV